MGCISKHPISKFIINFNCRCFVETGTYKGSGVKIATKFDFNQIFSIDISSKHYNETFKKFRSDPRVELYIGDSGINLKDILAEVRDSNNVLFWLDAHLPDLNGEQDNLPKDVIIPLERELNLIKSIRNITGDVFVIDDLRLFEYVDVPMFENCFAKDSNKYRSSQFIVDLLNDTHDIVKDYRDQGYLVAIPKRN